MVIVGIDGRASARQIRKNRDGLRLDRELPALRVVARRRQRGTADQFFEERPASGRLGRIPVPGALDRIGIARLMAIEGAGVKEHSAHGRKAPSREGCQSRSHAINFALSTTTFGNIAMTCVPCP